MLANDVIEGECCNPNEETASQTCCGVCRLHSYIAVENKSQQFMPCSHPVDVLTAIHMHQHCNCLSTDIFGNRQIGTPSLTACSAGMMPPARLHCFWGGVWMCRILNLLFHSTLRVEKHGPICFAIRHPCFSAISDHSRQCE